MLIRRLRKFVVDTEFLLVILLTRSIRARNKKIYVKIIHTSTLSTRTFFFRKHGAAVSAWRFINAPTQVRWVIKCVANSFLWPLCNLFALTSAKDICEWINFMMNSFSIEVNAVYQFKEKKYATVFFCCSHFGSINYTETN